MDTNELKFLLKLLGYHNYRSSLSAFSSFKAKNKICEDLGNRELVDYSREIDGVKILPAGKAVLKADTTDLPITDKERKVLESISKASGKISPSKITVKSLKAAEKQEILKNFKERGLIDFEMKRKKNKAEVWITQRGLEYLREDYNPKGSATISLDLLGNYLRFLRKSPCVQLDKASSLPDIKAEPVIEREFNDQDILQTIQNLDRQLGTDNYLPIFHLRQKLEPALSREQLDKALYRLQGNDQIELSTLAEPETFSSEQLDAGIPQRRGGLLFFITTN